MVSTYAYYGSEGDCKYYEKCEFEESTAFGKVILDYSVCEVLL